MKTMIFGLVVILTALSYSGCAKRVTVVDTPFRGFIKYKVPKRVKAKIEGREHCKINNIPKVCLEYDEVINIVHRSRKLERIINNYNKDISDFNDYQNGKVK